jgi:5,6,7,8-tetrahydromethanopterin hydro-lyase
VSAATHTQFGEGFAGEGANAAHLNTVLGARGSAVETAWATALATPSAGHAAFVCVIRPGLPVRPLTLFVNKAEIRGDKHGQLTWGAAQAGVATGVAQSVSDGTVSRDLAATGLLIAAVWVDWEASDADAVFDNNLVATRMALAAGATGAPTIDDVMVEADSAWNPFFRDDRRGQA